MSRMKTDFQWFSVRFRIQIPIANQGLKQIVYFHWIYINLITVCCCLLIFIIIFIQYLIITNRSSGIINPFKTVPYEIRIKCF